MRSTRAQPASEASRSRARVFDELAEPITTTASQRGAISSRADWRLVVAKHRSDRPGVHSPGKRAAVASATWDQSRWLRVVWASRATGCSNGGRASTSASDSTRWMASGATAMVPTASSCPSWPT